jgi:hypothetical protein
VGRPDRSGPPRLRGVEDQPGRRGARRSTLNTMRNWHAGMRGPDSPAHRDPGTSGLPRGTITEARHAAASVTDAAECRNFGMYLFTPEVEETASEPRMACRQVKGGPSLGSLTASLLIQWALAEPVAGLYPDSGLLPPNSGRLHA